MIPGQPRDFIRIPQQIVHIYIEKVRDHFRRLEIGTGDSGTGQIALYLRCGLVRCGIDEDYFRKYYPAPIFENGVECRHMIRMSMEL